jgi:glycosyltransferase involved in cell wall biosynthesis
MKVLKRVVVSWLATARGGAEQSSVELCRALHDRYGVEVVLVFWHYGPKIAIPGLDGGSGVQVMHCHSAADYRKHLAAALRRVPHSTVLLSNHRTYQVDLHLARKRAVKCAVLFRQTPLRTEAFRTLPTHSASELVCLSGNELDWQTLNGAEALVGISDFGVRNLASFAPHHPHIVRIYNGVQVAGHPGPVTPRPVRRFLVVSRLLEWKAIDFAIDAFGLLRRSRRDVRLQIAGEGEIESCLRDVVNRLGLAQCVEFLGFREDIRAVYKDNDCLLHGCANESFGRVVVEASACGLPAVVAQSAGTGEVVVNGHTGLTFRPGDLADCSRALRCAYDLTPDTYQRLARTAQQRAATLFHPHRAVEEYFGLGNAMLLNGGQAAAERPDAMDKNASAKLYGSKGFAPASRQAVRARARSGFARV